MTEETKVCSVCKCEKTLEDFYLKSKSGTKRASACKTCVSAQAKEKYKDQSYRAKKVNNKKCLKSWGAVTAEFLKIRPNEY